MRNLVLPLELDEMRFCMQDLLLRFLSPLARSLHILRRLCCVSCSFSPQPINHPMNPNRSTLKTNLCVLIVDAALVFLFAARANASAPATNLPPLDAPRSIPCSSPEQPVSSDVEEEGGLGAVYFGFGGVGRADVADSSSSYALSGFEVGASIGPVGASFKRLSFDWNQPADFLPAARGDEPWRNLDEASVSLSWGGPLVDQISYLLLGGASLGYEDQTDDAYSLFGGGIVAIQMSSNWSASAGAILSHHPKVSTDLDFVPVLGAAWRADAPRGLSLSLGIPSTEIAWTFRPGTRIVLDMSSFEGGLYRLADDNPRRPAGYVELLNSSLALRAETLLWNRLGLSFGFVQALDRKFKTYDPDGKNEKSYDVDNASGFIASVSLDF